MKLDVNIRDQKYTLTYILIDKCRANFYLSRHVARHTCAESKFKFFPPFPTFSLYKLHSSYISSSPHSIFSYSLSPLSFLLFHYSLIFLLFTFILYISLLTKYNFFASSLFNILYNLRYTLYHSLILPPVLNIGPR